MNTDENKMPQQQTQPSPELNESGAVKLQGISRFLILRLKRYL
jgi:hypothetical protein